MSSHGTSTPSTSGGGGNNINLLRWIPISLAMLIVLILMGQCITRHKKEAERTRAVSQQNYPAPPTHPVEALVLMSECFTPCSANIAWKFKIRTDGHPLDITWQGVSKPVSYPAEGDFSPPDGMRSGEQKISSPDGHVKVQVYKRITVEGGR